MRYSPVITKQVLYSASYSVNISIIVLFGLLDRSSRAREGYESRQDLIPHDLTKYYMEGAFGLMMG